MDLPLTVGGSRVGVEIKFSEAPRAAKSEAIPLGAVLQEAVKLVDRRSQGASLG